MNDFDILCKIVVVGDSGVGKSCLIKRFADNKFDDETQSTIGVDFAVKTMELEGRIWKLQIWDTAGQEKFRAIATSFYRGAHGVIVCYDTTKPSSLDNVERWLQDIRKYTDSHVPVVLVGTKTDVQRSFDDSDSQFAAAKGIPLMKTSAKNNKNIDETITLMLCEIQEYLSSIPATKNISNDSKFLSSTPLSMTDRCC
eukprot:c19424_g1_i2.p1 GENE.c19424_g1_i2~~c19424_g1_i2.p1  ORF type:complete len:198 (+),score=91.86 c19424_g1_i2:82-675(+)